MTVSTDQRKAIIEAFRGGKLRVGAVDPDTGQVCTRACTQVHKHSSGEKNLVRLTLADGREGVFTLDHSVYVLDRHAPAIKPVPASEISRGYEIAVVCGDKVVPKRVEAFEYLPPQEFTYDLGVPGLHNFALSNGILAHNSYSIGGISLDVSKSDKYKGMKDQAEQRFKEQGKEVKLQTLKIIKGLRQPKYGVGVRSSFGPHVAKGVLSPRSFVGF